MTILPKSSKITFLLFGIFLAVVVISYCLFGLFFSSRIQDLGKQNKDLLEKSKTLEEVLKAVKTEDKVLIEGLQGEKKELKMSLDSLKKENESLRFSMTKIETQQKNAVDDKRALEEMLVNKTREIEAMKTEPGASFASVPVPGAATVFAPNTPQEIVTKIAEKDSEIRALNEQNRILAEKLDKLYKIMNEKITQISIAKIALEETVAEARKKINEEWNTVNLGSIDVSKQNTASGPSGNDAPPVPPSGPKKEGKVLAANDDQGFVVVDMGKVDNLTSDAKLVVKRDGKYIATLTILEIRDIMSACHIKILSENEKIQVNDLVTIRK